MEKILLWVATLVTFGVLTVFAQAAQNLGLMDPILLDMAANSVDDSYNGYREEMRKRAPVYLDDERNRNEAFRKAWAAANRFYTQTWLNKEKGPRCQRLRREHVMAMHIYTLDRPKVYRHFNQAVRTEGAEYTSPAFGYHALHFYLTDAIQTSNSQTLGSSDTCVTTYRRVKRYFIKRTLTKHFRFGAFTSSSVGRYPSPGFGRRTCFKITSCFGAEIAHCSAFSKEREFLIPPYEVFKVTKKEKRSNNKELPCEVVYTVESTKSPMSNLNCALVPGHKNGGKCSWMKGKLCG